ncbi:MAG: cupredoxin domain-containing protein [Acidisphaera sp.]|nr:cupredoxin domain-containing protein [Acidisphaera sp.]
MRIGTVPGLRIILPVVAGCCLAATGPTPAPMQELEIRNHQFEPPELHLKAGEPASIHVRNLDPTVEEFGSSALNVEKVIPGNSEAVVHLRRVPAGRYPFMGEFHPDTAQGVVVGQ